MKKEEYLDEDSDLIEVLSSIHAEKALKIEDRISQKLLELQIKGLLRTRKTYKDSEDRTERFSWILAIFTMVQIFIALFQFILDLFPVNNTFLKIVIFLMFICFFIGFIVIGFHEAKKK